MKTEHESLRVRSATLLDLETIAQVNIALARDTEDKDLSLEIVRSGVRQGFSRPESCRYFVAEQRDQLVGQLMLTFEWSDWRAGFFWWIQSVYVEPDCRGQGVFGQLYRFIESLAQKDQGCCGIRLYVETENSRAMRTYEKLGMTCADYKIFESNF